MSKKGIYRKYNVTRTDGSSEPGNKHADCIYFVLDIKHDPHALPALKAYYESVFTENQQLALDIQKLYPAADWWGIRDEKPSEEEAETVKARYNPNVLPVPNDTKSTVAGLSPEPIIEQAIQDVLEAVDPLNAKIVQEKNAE